MNVNEPIDRMMFADDDEGDRAYEQLCAAQDAKLDAMMEARWEQEHGL